MSEDYKALTIETLSNRLGDIDALKARLGDDPNLWTSNEVGDGNLNLVFIVKGPEGTLIVKQALPYVRVVGESWPLTLKRAFFEHEALVRQAERTNNLVPEVYYFNQKQAILVMQFMQPHVILRHSLKDGIKHKNLAHDMGIFCAQTLFRGSTYALTAPAIMADLAVFSDNVALCNITEDLVFTDPYYDAQSNNINSPALDAVVTDLRNDVELKIAVQMLKTKFCTQNETLLHGDLHTGSIMVTQNETSVIDPEFATYGPIGFDVGMLLANFWMAYFAQQGQQTADDDRDDYRAWILKVAENIWSSFTKEFSNLWQTERNGILFEDKLFKDQGHQDASDRALNQLLTTIWQDAIGFAGAEMIRRTIGLAHIMEIDTIEDIDARANVEKNCIAMGRKLITQTNIFTNIDKINQFIIKTEKDSKL